LGILRFGQPMQSGLLEIVAPPASFYPDMARLRTTLNDPPERVRWRTKQNLDYAFLMMYAQSRGTYYVQLEDDILTAPGYASKMLRFALDKEARKDEWFLLDFCQLGFIGKMFRSVDLPYLIQFSVMFANDKPVDWLLGPLLETRFCPHDAVSVSFLFLSFFHGCRPTSVVPFVCVFPTEKVHGHQSQKVGPLQAVPVPARRHDILPQG